MWWGWGSWGRGGWRGGSGWSWWPFGLMILFFMFSGWWSWGWWTWIALLFFAPLVFSALKNVFAWFSNQSNTADDEYEKQKRGGDVYVFDDEKQKREPRYTLGDDGELVELEPGEADKPKRRSQNDDMLDYV